MENLAQYISSNNTKYRIIGHIQWILSISIFTFSVMFAAMQLQPYDDGNFKEFHSVNLKMCKLMSDILEKEEPSTRDLEETDELLNQWTRHVESCVAVAQV